MGLSIGQNPSILAALGTTRSTNRVGSAVPGDRASFRETATQTADRENTVQVGFGKNSISGIAAAFRTLDTNLAQARKVVPDFEELNAQARAASAEQRARLSEAFTAASKPDAEIRIGQPRGDETNSIGPEQQRLIPEASGQASKFDFEAAHAVQDVFTFQATQEEVSVGPGLPRQEPLNLLA